MKESHRAVLAPLLSAAVENVFATYGEEGREASSSEHGHDIVAVIGFSSQNVKGGLALGICADLARRIAPSPTTELADWTGEICNQVLGRLRNQLLRYEMDLNLATPVVLAGVGIDIKPSRAGTLHHQCFSASGHVFEAFLEASFVEGYEFPEPSAEEVAAPESSVLMFSERASE